MARRVKSGVKSECGANFLNKMASIVRPRKEDPGSEKAGYVSGTRNDRQNVYIVQAVGENLLPKDSEGVPGRGATVMGETRQPES